MSVLPIAPFVFVVALPGTGGNAPRVEPEAVQTSAHMLRAFLGNDALLWGCMAMGLIALVTVAKVASRRRKAGKASRMAREQSDAVHGFLNAVREGHTAAKQGMWHFDCVTLEQQYSDNLRALICGCGQGLATDEQMDEILAHEGLNLANLARDRLDHTQPYEAPFTLKSEDSGTRQMILRACNFRGGNGEVQRVVAVISEASEPLQGLGGSD